MTSNVNQAKKDRREWTIMNLFAENCSCFPIGKIEKSECPDFIVTTEKKKIGIELTELKYERRDKEFNMRAHEDFLSDIMLRAQGMYEKRQDLTLVVDVHFSDNIAPDIIMSPESDDADLLRVGLSESIARIVYDNQPEATGKKYIVDRMSKYGDMNLPKVIESIHIKNVTGRMEDALWYASISTRVKPLSVASIAQRIDDKNNKMLKYDNTCDEQWLLIIQNSFLMSSQYDPVAVKRALKHRYSSRFKRVFVFERSEGVVTELSVIRKIR